MSFPNDNYIFVVDTEGYHHDKLRWRQSWHYDNIRFSVSYSVTFTPRSHLADLTADLSRPWWSGEVLWSRREIGKDRGWVLEGPERSVNLVEVSPTIPDCFELFKTIGSGRGWRAVVDGSVGSRVRSLQRACIVGKEPGRLSQPTTHDWITSI